MGHNPATRQTHYRWYDDDADVCSNTAKAVADTSINQILRGDILRLRIQGQEENNVAINVEAQLEYSTSTGGPWTAVPTTENSDPFVMYDSAQATTGTATTAAKCGTGGGTAGTWTNGNYFDDINPDITSITLDSQYTEWEVCIKATANAASNETYYFRITDAGTPFDDHDVYAELQMLGVAELSETISIVDSVSRSITLKETVTQTITILDAVIGDRSSAFNEFYIDSYSGGFLLDSILAKAGCRFTAKETKSGINKVAVYLHQITDPPTYRIGIQADDGSGDPTGIYLGSGTWTPISSGWNEVSISPSVSLTKGSIYHVVVQYESGSIAASNSVTLRGSKPRMDWQPRNADKNDVNYQDRNLRLRFSPDGISWFDEFYNTPMFVYFVSGSVVGGQPFYQDSSYAVFGNTRAGELLTTIKGTTLSKITFRARKVGSPADDLYWEIRDSGNNVLGSGTLITATIASTTFSNITADVSPTIEILGDVYRIDVYSPNSANASNCFELDLLINLGFNDETYGGDTNVVTISTDAGSSWTQQLTNDATFLLIGPFLAGPETRTIYETISISDAISKLLTSVRTLTDTISVVDAVTGVKTIPVITRTIYEAITISDQISRLLTASRSIPEIITIVDAVSKLSTFSKTISETISIIDQMATVVCYTRTVPEAISVLDQVSRLFTAYRTLTETISIIDSVSRLLIAFKTIQETISVLDSVTGVKLGVILRTISETISISDQLSRWLDAQRTITETVSVVDSISRLLSAFRTLTETITISDIAATNFLYSKTISEIITISDQISRLAIYARTIPETIPISDTLNRLAYVFKSLSETISILDSITAGLFYSRSISETVDISDTASRLLYAYRTISENISVSDLVSRILTTLKTLYETISIADSLIGARIGIMIRTISETVAVVATVSRWLDAGRTLSETIPITDAVSTAFFNTVVLTETIPIIARLIASKSDLYRISLLDARLRALEAVDYISIAQYLDDLLY